MSVLNLGLQSVGLDRRLVDSEEIEQQVSRCNNMAQVRDLAAKNSGIKDALTASIEPVKIKLAEITRSLELKGDKFMVQSAALPADIEQVWDGLKDIDPEFILFPDEKITHQKLTISILSFMKHCCCERHYFFDIKKCGDEDCDICLPPRLPRDRFSLIDHLPDPMPGNDGHYKSFSEVF